jgi:polyhydroxybutyrate depolymerase
MRLLPLLVTAAAAAVASPAVADAEREISVGGVARTYRIHVPPTWDRAKPVGVLFVFHGAGGDPESMVPTGFEILAAETPTLVVYPSAPERVKRYEVDPPAGRPSADVLFVDVLLHRLRERFPVDARRVYATGFSNGAALCYRLAAERPRVFAAIAPVAGYLPRLTRETPVVPVPVLHVHGTEDGVVGGADGGPVARWARWNGATRGPTATAFRAGGLSFRQTAYEGAGPRSDARLLLIEGAGHEWPGGPAGAVTKAIWEFLMAHPLDATPAPPPAGPVNPLVGAPFGATDALRGLPEFGGRPFTLLRWWTNECPHCVGSVPALAKLEDKYRARGLRMVAVYHPKGADLPDEGARAYAARLGFRGAIAFDDRWTKYRDLRDRGGLTAATSISVVVDSSGTIRWVHPGPRIEAGSADLAALDAFLDRTLPAAPAPGK